MPVSRLCHLLVLLFVLLAALTACDRAAPPLPVIRIGHAPHDHHAALYLAASLPGYFRDNGGVYLKEIVPKAEYELIDHSVSVARLLISSEKGGIKLVRKLDEEQLDLSYGGLPAMLSLIDQGSRLRILVPTMGEGAGFVVANHLPVADWDSFLALARSRPEPLKIGYKIGTSVQNIILEAALRESGVPYSRDETTAGARVVLVNLHGTENLLPALENNLIDGFVVNQPLVAMAVSKGAGKLLANLRDLPPAGRWAGIPCCALAGNETFVGRHSHEVETLTTLLMRANEYISAHPDESAALVAAWLGVPVAVEKLSIPTIRYSNVFDDQWHRGLDQWVETMVENGELNGQVRQAWQAGSLDDVIYSRLTEKLRRPAQ